MSGFPTTRWARIRAARVSESARRQLLSGFLTSYQVPLQRFLVRVRGLSQDAAEELVQGFVVDKVVLEGLLEHADERRGRLRTFLLRALTNYVLNVRRRERPAASMSPHDGESRFADPHGVPDPGCVFETEWARYVLERTLSAMRAECEGTGRRQLWQLFECRVLRPVFDGHRPTPYAELAEALAYAGRDQAMNALITARRMFARILRSVVAEYVTNDQAIEDEIHDLMAIVSRPAQDHGP